MEYNWIVHLNILGRRCKLAELAVGHTYTLGWFGPHSLSPLQPQVGLVEYQLVAFRCLGGELQVVSVGLEE